MESSEDDGIPGVKMIGEGEEISCVALFDTGPSRFRTAARLIALSISTSSAAAMPSAEEVKLERTLRRMPSK